MRIVITAISFCEYIIQQANGLAAIGHHVLVIFPESLVKRTIGSDMRDFLKSGVDLFVCAEQRPWKTAYYRAPIKKIISFAPDVLHIHDNGEMITMALLTLFKRLPLVVTIHDVAPHPGADSLQNIRRKRIKSMLRSRADAIHLHGRSLYEQLRMLHPNLAGKTTIIPHGTLSLFASWESEAINREPLTCLFFGRMEKYRGLDNLLIIGHKLKDALPGVRIIVAGRGTELDKYKADMAAVGIFEIHDDYIPNREIHRYFKRVSVLLLPYHEASQSGVVAMGIPFGLPVVATDVGAISETIVDGRHGRIIPVGDLDGFTASVLEILSNETLRQTMETECLRLSESLDFENLAKDYEALYHRTIECRS